MDDYMIKAQASEDFNKARSKEFFSRVLGFLSPKNKELLSFREIKSLVGAKGERYKGMQVVPIEKIVGSEGRYRDFNKTFLPRHNFFGDAGKRSTGLTSKTSFFPPSSFIRSGTITLSGTATTGFLWLKVRGLALLTLR
jgi:hypothetical protein